MAEAAQDGEFDRYERMRNRLSRPMFDRVDDLVRLDWTNDEAGRILRDIGNHAAEEQNELRRYWPSDRSTLAVAGTATPPRS